MGECWQGKDQESDGVGSCRRPPGPSALPRRPSSFRPVEGGDRLLVDSSGGVAKWPYALPHSSAVMERRERSNA